MKKVLITGVDGFVGTHLKKLLRDEQGDAQIFGLSNNLLESNPSENFTGYQCSVLDFDQVTQVIGEIGPDYVFHLAGMAFVPDASAMPSMAINVNAMGAFHVFEAIARHVPTARVVTVSSSTVYGTQSFEKPLSEDLPAAPNDIYGLSKAMMESFANFFFKEKGLDIIVMRAFNHVGPGQSENFVVSNFAKQIAEMEAKSVGGNINVGDLTPVRDFTDVRDIVRAYYLAAQKGKGGQVYNICRGKGFSIQEILDILVAQANVQVQIRRDPNRYRKTEIPKLVGSNHKFKTDTGWQPLIEIQQTLLDVLNYWRTNLHQTARI